MSFNDSVIERDNFDDYINLSEDELYNQYEQHISISKKHLRKIEEITFKYDLPISEYQKGLRLIEQYKNIYKNILDQKIGDYPVNTDKSKFDRVRAIFLERNEHLKKQIKKFKGYKKVIKGTIEKIKEHEKPNDLITAFSSIKRELLSLELYDKEVLWKEFYQQTNTSFLKVKENSHEYIYKENEFIKIKALTFDTKHYKQDLDKLVSEFEITVGAEPSFLNDLESIKEKLNKAQTIALKMMTDFDVDHSFLEEVYSGKVGKPKLKIGHQYNFNTSFFWREFAPFFNLDSPYSGFSFKDSACFWGDNNQRIYITTGFLYNLQYVLRLRLASIEKIIEVVSNRLKPVDKINFVTNDSRIGSDSCFLDEQLNNSTITNEIKSELTFEGLFPSIEDMNIVNKMLVELKIINQEGKYLLGNKTGIIRVFIDVMKEEGYFVDIERKPILRVFTPKILGRTIEVIKEPTDFENKKKKILKKLAELVK